MKLSTDEAAGVLRGAGELLPDEVLLDPVGVPTREHPPIVIASAATAPQALRARMSCPFVECDESTEGRGPGVGSDEVA